MTFLWLFFDDHRLPTLYAKKKAKRHGVHLTFLNMKKLTSQREGVGVGWGRRAGGWIRKWGDRVNSSIARRREEIQLPL